MAMGHSKVPALRGRSWTRSHHGYRIHSALVFGSQVRGAGSQIQGLRRNDFVRDVGEIAKLITCAHTLVRTGSGARSGNNARCPPQARDEMMGQVAARGLDINDTTCAYEAHASVQRGTTQGKLSAEEAERAPLRYSPALWYLTPALRHSWRYDTHAKCPRNGCVC